MLVVFVALCRGGLEVRAGLVVFLGFEQEVVGEAENGVEAVEMTQRLTPDVVLMDLVMPEMGGVELRDRLVEDHPELSTLFMSGYDRADSGRQHPLRPEDQLLVKPFSPTFLVERIIELLRDRDSA